MSVSKTNANTQSPAPCEITDLSFGRINKPEAGSVLDISLAAGQNLVFAFDATDITDVNQNESGALRIHFDNDAVIILENYAQVNPQISYEAGDAFNVAMDDVTGEAGVVDSASAEAVIEQGSGEGSPGDIIEEVIEELAEEVSEALAEVEPAAGEAQDLANIEPAAGEGAEGGARGGYGFQSSFDPQGVQTLDDIGPIDPTSLEYSANFREPNPASTADGPDASGPVGPNVDDSPEAGPGAGAVDETSLENGGPVEVSGELDIDFGADGPGSIQPDGDVGVSGSVGGESLTSGGTPVDISVTPNGYVGMAGGEMIFSLEINPNTGEFVFTLFGDLDHGDSSDPNDILKLEFGIVVTDADGDAVRTTITIDVADDGPRVEGGDTLSVDESGLAAGQAASGKLNIEFGADGEGSVETTGEVSGDPLMSQGEPVTVTSTPDGYVGMSAEGVPIFTLTLNPDTGEYEFTLLGPLDHFDPSNPDDLLTIEFGVRITDGDGDYVDTTIKVEVADDGPSITGEARAIGEGRLETHGEIVVKGQLDHDYGADGSGDIEPTGTFKALFEMGGSEQELTSGGEPVEVTATEDGYVAMVGGEIAFQITMNPDGSYTYKQFLPIDHPGEGDPGDVIWMKFEFQIVDADGDIDTAYVVIDLHDSGPEANDDFVGLRGGEGETLVGDVMENDSIGADHTDNAVTSVEFDGQSYEMPEDGTLTIEGQYGILTIHSDGTYSYVRTGTGEGEDVFSYTITDADGDSATADLVIDVESGAVLTTHAGPRFTPADSDPGLFRGESEGVSFQQTGNSGNNANTGNFANVVMLSAAALSVQSADAMETLSANASELENAFANQGISFQVVNAANAAVLDNTPDTNLFNADQGLNVWTLNGETANAANSNAQSENAGVYLFSDVAASNALYGDSLAENAAGNLNDMRNEVQDLQNGYTEADMAEIVEATAEPSDAFQQTAPEEPGARNSDPYNSNAPMGGMNETIREVGLSDAAESNVQGNTSNIIDINDVLDIASVNGSQNVLDYVTNAASGSTSNAQIPNVIDNVSHHAALNAQTQNMAATLDHHVMNADDLAMTNLLELAKNAQANSVI